MAAGNNYPETPGKGVMYFNQPEDRKHELAPDFSGFVVLELDYKAGEKVWLGAWEKPTSRGTRLLVVKEDNWVKKKRMEEEGKTQASRADRPVTPAYDRKKCDDEDVPF